MKILIATATAPRSEEGFKNICDIIRSEAESRGLSVNKGILFTGGPGCANLAFELLGDDAVAESYANMITMAFMPSKWCTTQDALPDTDMCDIPLEC